MFKKNSLLLSFFALLFLSVVFLFWSADRPFGASWWAVYFSESEKSGFIIENHSQETHFRWEIWKDGEKKDAQEADCVERCFFEVENGNKEKILIKIWQGEDVREIYKK